MESLDDVPIVGWAEHGLIPVGHRVVLLPTDDLAGQKPWPRAETWVGWVEILGMGVRPRWNR